MFIMKLKAQYLLQLLFENTQEDEEFTMTGIDNYGLKPTETKIRGTGDITIKTDANVDKFSLMLECHKESGFRQWLI